MKRIWHWNGEVKNYGNRAEKNEKNTVWSGEMEKREEAM